MDTPVSSCASPKSEGFGGGGRRPEGAGWELAE